MATTNSTTRPMMLPIELFDWLLKPRSYLLLKRHFMLSGPNVLLHQFEYIV